MAGSEINDDPYAPISRRAIELVAELGDETPIAWVHRSERYGEKLATPDTTIADLIGEVDPIKIAEGRYLTDELALSYGLVPRVNRGIFAINELPDLAERIQVGLLNVLEERDIQIRGHRIRLPLDLVLVATANPEDYTNRGRIITPLKDRFGAQIRTHYPRDLETELEIARSEASLPPSAVPIIVPWFIERAIVEISQLARRSPLVNQRSGVSVRLTIANYESVVANALRRTLRTGATAVVPRVSDLAAVVPSTQGKIEIEAMEEGREEEVVAQLVAAAVLLTFRDQIVLEDAAGDRCDLRRRGRGPRRRRPRGRRLPRGARSAAGARARDAQDRRRAGRGRGDGRCAGVPPRGPAPDEAAEQGRLGPARPLPPAPPLR